MGTLRWASRSGSRLGGLPEPAVTVWIPQALWMSCDFILSSSTGIPNAPKSPKDHHYSSFELILMYMI
jgi:hypothetical protein